MEINISPVPKPRMTRADRWKRRKCVERYFEYCDELRSNGLEIGDILEVIFFIPMPKSWSKKKKKEMCLRPHKQRPDLDNLVKAINDAANKEDSHIYIISAEKYWDYNGRIVIGERK